MNVAIIGKGKWSHLLHHTLAEMGGHIVTMVEGHGAFSHPSDAFRFVQDLGADAVLFAVPPSIQAKLAPAYIAGGFPCFLEKPLQLPRKHVNNCVVCGAAEFYSNEIHSGAHKPGCAAWENYSITGRGKWLQSTAWSPFESLDSSHALPVIACDHLRTMAPSWKLFKASQREILQTLSVVVGGPGPERDWPVKSTALWDYGPHAVAYLLDLCGPGEFVLGEVIQAPGPGALTFSFRYGKAKMGAITVSNRSQNGKVAKVSVNEKVNYSYDSDTERPLQATLQAFFDAVEGKAPLPEQLSLSRGIEIVKILEQVEAKL
jgi:predicted dehydrogenase